MTIVPGNDVWNKIPGGSLSAFHFGWLIIIGFFIGIIAGSVIAAFRVSTDKVYDFMINWARPQNISGFEIFFFLCIALLAALIVGLLIRNKAIRFGGADWIQEALAKGQIHPFLKILVPKFLGSWLVMAMGISVGREGPCIQMGAATAMSLMRGERNNQIKRRFFILAGCSAGLAAAFTAPFTGICYVYEVMKEKIGRLLLLFMLAGSFGVYVSLVMIFDLGIMVPIPDLNLPDVKYFLLLVPLGIATGAVGVAYNYCLRYFTQAYARQKLIPIPLRPLFAFIGAALMILFFPAITGEGLTIIPVMLKSDTLISYLCLFLAAKLLFTAYCYGTGIPAGLMVPILCLGAVMGGIIGNICLFFNLMPRDLLTGFIVLGMSGAYAASERAPITALVLTLEMTGAWVLAPGMLLVVAIASLCGKLANVGKM